MRNTRLALEPAVSQIKLSQDLGYSYSVVTSWENGGRNILRNQLLDWAKAVGVSTDMENGPLAEFNVVVLDDGLSRPNKGERIERDINERLKLLRKDRKLTLREMAEITGISYSHYARVEHNRGNLSITQLRSIAKQLKVSYDYLIDGAELHETTESLREKIAILTRENELLESFRQTFAARQQS